MITAEVLVANEKEYQALVKMIIRAQENDKLESVSVRKVSES